MNNFFGQNINEDVRHLLEEMEETSGSGGHPEKPEAAAKHTADDKTDTAAELEKMLREVEEAADAAEIKETDVPNAPEYAADSRTEEKPSFGMTNEKRSQNEEILAKSRREYHNNDPLETEAVKASAKTGMIAGLCACLLFLTIEFFGTLFGFGRHDPAIGSIFYAILGGELIGRAVKSQKRTLQVGLMIAGILLSLCAFIGLVTYLTEIYVQATGRPLFS